MKKLEPMVKELLEYYPATREDDFYLVGSVYYMIKPEIKTKTFLDIMKKHKEYGLPSFESITRARRKVQAENDNLISNKAKRIREKEEREYFEYYKGVI